MKYSLKLNITESITQTYDKSFELCQGTSDLGNGYNCANEEECANTNITIIATGSTLCCSGGKSCFDVANIIVSPNNDSLSYSFLTDLRCDGAYSCYDGSSYKSNGSLYLTGANSGEESRLLSGKTGVFCRGSYSCTSDRFDVEIITGIDGTDGGDVVCSGFYSCHDVTIYGAKTIYVLAGEGSRGSIFYNTSGDIVCALKRACQSTQIKNVGGSVFALGREALAFREIYNVGGNIYAFSWYALKQCEIKNVTGMKTHWVVRVFFCLFFFCFG